MRTTIFSTPILTPLLRIISVTTLKLIGWKTPIEDMYPYLERKELKNNLNDIFKTVLEEGSDDFRAN